MSTSCARQTGRLAQKGSVNKARVLSRAMRDWLRVVANCSSFTTELAIPSREFGNSKVRDLVGLLRSPEHDIAVLQAA